MFFLAHFTINLVTAILFNMMASMIWLDVRISPKEVIKTNFPAALIRAEPIAFFGFVSLTLWVVLIGDKAAPLIR